MTNIFQRKTPGIKTMVAVALLTASTTAHCQLTVIDPANLQQNIVTSIESVTQTTKQIAQYQLQLQQYENMLRNTAAPAVAVWDQAQSSMNRLRGAMDTLSYYKSALGGLDSYLGKFQDVNYYRSSPCFNPNATCTAAQWRSLQEATAKLGSEAQKKANDALFRSLDAQQDAMISDARQLERLQAAAQGAGGQVEAIGYANQLASHQANQLLQIRALLIAQKNALITRKQVLADQ